MTKEHKAKSSINKNNMSIKISDDIIRSIIKETLKDESFITSLNNAIRRILVNEYIHSKEWKNLVIEGTKEYLSQNNLIHLARLIKKTSKYKRNF